jgi:site-specific DNA-cytosine methylase
MSPNWLALEKVKNMEKDDQKSFPIGKAYDFAKDNGLGDQGKKIQDLEFDGVPQKRERIIRKGYLIRLFGDHGIYSGFITKYWPYGATEKEDANIVLNLRTNIVIAISPITSPMVRAFSSQPNLQLRRICGIFLRKEII